MGRWLQRRHKRYQKPSALKGKPSWSFKGCIQKSKSLVDIFWVY